MRHRLRIVACVVVALFPAPSQAGLLDLLFGGRSPPQPARAPASFPPAALAPAPAPATTPRASGGSRVFCVRLCDGFHFPLDAVPSQGADALCAASCEGTDVAVFRGLATAVEAAIDRAGRRYADLPNAFAYRTSLREGCGCRRTEGYAGLMQRILGDPTLRKGDIVVTLQGASVFSPATQARTAWTGADFVDIRRPGALSQAAWKQAERLLGPTFDAPSRAPSAPIRVAERRENEIVVTPMRRLEPRVIVETPFAR